MSIILKKVIGITLAAATLGGAQFAVAAPVCSTGSDGTSVVSTDNVRVNVYFPAPDPAVAATVVAAGATSVPIDVGLGGQATNLHSSVSASIAAGDVLLVVQMMGAEINSDDNQQATGDYGDGPGLLEQAGALDNANLIAGRSEFVVATGPVNGGEIPIEGVGAGNGLLYEYINSNDITASSGFRRYQVVKVPQFSNLTVTGEIVSDRWNGRWGGVTAVNVRENLTLSDGQFNADGRGFRGGQFFPARSQDTGANPGNFGYKGEGVAGMPQRLFSRVLLEEAPVSNGEETGPAGYPGTDGAGPNDTAWTRDSGQGAPATAGSGGGGSEDAGGGGGGNFARGGAGGEGSSGNDTNGHGGAAYPQHSVATPTLMVMGGGGGASNGDDIDDLDLTVSSGQAGGGLVFVRSVAINTTGVSTISSNGDAGGVAATEGGGGGGAAGSILVHTDNSTAGSMVFSAAGGMGGSSSQFNDGGGGGGSGGVIWLSDTDAGSASFTVAGGLAGTGASGGDNDGAAGEVGASSSIGAIAQFDCNFVTLGIAKELTSQSRIGNTGGVFDLAFTVTIENFSNTPASNVQIVDNLATAFPGAASINVIGTPVLDGFSAPVIAYDGDTQVNLLLGTDTMAATSVNTLTYTVRVDFGAATGPFSTQAQITSSQVAGGFAQVLDQSDSGTDPDADGDNDPTETLANGGDSDDSEATAVVLDFSVSAASCTFMPSPALTNTAVTAACTGVETGGSITIDGMVCGAEAGGTVNCSGTASGIGPNPEVVTTDAADNFVMNNGVLLVVLDADGDGIPDVLEGMGDSDGDGLADFLDGDSDNDGIDDIDENSMLPALTGLDTDGDTIDDAIDVTQTAGTDDNGDGIDDAFTSSDLDSDSIPNHLDADSDNDGIPDVIEGSLDNDNDSLPNYLDIDSDFDGILDSVEADNLPDLLGMDADFDGIDDAFDVTQTSGDDTNTNGIDDRFEPTDTDGDLIPDYLDIDSDDDQIPDAVEGVVDTDGDDLGNWRDTDSDSDGVLDSAEGPSGNDADGDGIDDNYDPNATDEIDANGNGVVDDPLTVDTNSDGFPNVDTDNDTRPDYLDLDSDNDSINDIIEAGLPDTDENALIDVGTAPVGQPGLPDADSDGIPDFQEVDSNNDGAFDIAATQNAGLDSNADGRIDLIADSDADGIPNDTDRAPNNFGEPDVTVVAALCVLAPNQALAGVTVTATCTGVESGAVITIPGMVCGAENAQQVVCTGLAEAVGTMPAVTTTDPANNVAQTTGDFTFLLATDSDGDGLPDAFEGTADFDGDGLVDSLDPDSDNDGILDIDERGTVPVLSGLDTDGDGIDDAVDVSQTSGNDANNDGIDDAFSPLDTDGDGVEDFRDADADGDGIPDILETGLMGMLIDSDNDGVPNQLDVDSDNDGLTDAVEADNMPGSTGVDSDTDGIDDAFDVDQAGGNDSNSNGFADATEPVDTDGDSIPDFLDIDSDNDGVPDAIEADLDSDGDTVPNWRDTDADNDGILDSAEGPSGVDSDSDGIDDVYDTDVNGAADADNNGVVDDVLVVDADNNSIPDTDTDNDGVADYLDLDSDNDSINDVIEVNQPDIDGNGFVDAGNNPIGTGSLPDADSNGTPDFQQVDANSDGTFDIAVDAATAAVVDTDNNGVVDNPSDTDGDGIANLVDGAMNTFGDAVDDDGDGIANASEGRLAATDTDDDTIPDYLDLDSDDDGIPDELEGDADADNDTVGNWRDLDSDADDITDAQESDAIAEFTDVDTDADGIPDGIDADATGGNDVNSNGVDDRFEPNDFDDDGTPDFLDTDSDNDGILDLLEGVIDTDGDGAPDYLDADSDNDGVPDRFETGDKDGDGIIDRLDQDEGKLETSVRGAGSFGLMSVLLLLVLTALAVRRRWFSASSVTVSPSTLSTLVAGFLLVGFLAWQTPVAAEASCSTEAGEFDGCFYGGLGLGLSHVEPEGRAGGWSTNDNRDSSWHGFIGYWFKPNWSAELRYLDGGEAGLGNIDPALDAFIPDAGIEYETPSLMGVYWLRSPVEKFNVFAKFGVAAIANESNSALIPFEEQTSVQVAFGAGGLWRFTPRWFLRGDLDLYDRDHLNLSLSVGMYLFDGNKSRKAVADPSAAIVQKAPMIADPQVSAVPVAAVPVTAPIIVPACDSVDVLEGVTFDNNSAYLTAESKVLLQSMVEQLQQFGDVVSVQISAHTDSGGSSDYNVWLSDRRAKSVVTYFVDRGVNRDRLTSKGYGEERPIADNETQEGRAKNRRVELMWQAKNCR